MKESILLQQCISYLEECKLTKRLPPFIAFHPINEGREFAFKDPTTNYIGTNRFGFLRGLADIVLCIQNGQVIFIELKIGSNKLNDNQKKFQELCEKTGFQYYVVKNSLNNFKKLINTLKKQTH